MHVNQRGFTLIELILVIVILGILAVTAAPRFIDLGSDARRADLMALSASVESAAELTFAKAIVSDVYKDSSNTQVTINGARVELKYGYPEAKAENNRLGIVELLDLSEEWQLCLSSSCTDYDSTNSSRVNIGFFDLDDSDPLDNECFVRYTEPGGTGNNEPDNRYMLEVFDADC